MTWAFGVDRGPLVAPGMYTVKLAVGDKELQQSLEILKDPNTAGTVADIREQNQMAMELLEDLETVAEMIDEIELLRKQINGMQALLKDKVDVEDVIEKSKEVDDKLDELAGHLYQRKLTGGIQDPLRWPIQLFAKVANLAGDVESVDFPPTNQMKEVHAMYKRQIAERRTQLDTILGTDLAALNDLLRTKNISNIITDL